jgi:hypothetical protein
MFEKVTRGSQKIQKDEPEIRMDPWPLELLRRRVVRFHRVETDYTLWRAKPIARGSAPACTAVKQSRQERGAGDESQTKATGHPVSLMSRDQTQACTCPESRGGGIGGSAKADRDHSSLFTHLQIG